MRQPTLRFRQQGFTLFELLIVLVIVGILVGYGLVYSTLLAGNYWFSEASVLRELRADHPNITEVLKTERNIYFRSVVTVKEGDARQNYCLDTNVLFNYEFEPCK